MGSQEKERFRGIRFPASLDAEIESAAVENGHVTPTGKPNFSAQVRLFCEAGLGKTELAANRQTVEKALEFVTSLRGEIRKVGVNINQITRYLNYGEVPDLSRFGADIEKLSELLTITQKIVKGVENGIGKQ